MSNCQCSASLNFLRKILSTLDPIDGPYSNFTLFSRVTVRAGSVSVFQNIAISVFPHEPTVAYRMTPSLTSYALPFAPNGVWALELQIAAIRDSDIVT